MTLIFFLQRGPNVLSSSEMVKVTDFCTSSGRGFHVVDSLLAMFEEGAKCLGRLHNVQSCWFRLLSTFRGCSTVALLLSSECLRRGPLFSDILQVSIFCQIRCLGPTLGAKVCHLYYYSSGFNKVTLQSTHWSIQTLPISGGDSSCSWVFYSCTGPKCGVGVDLVDCNAVGGGHVATSIDQSVRISACGALALEEYKQSASVQPLLCNS